MQHLLLKRGDCATMLASGNGKKRIQGVINGRGSPVFPRNIYARSHAKGKVRSREKLFGGG